MGAVFQGLHEGTGRPVAVKVLNPEHATNPELRDRFLREARVAAALKHPNVVDVLDMGEEADGTAYMVLELLRGEEFARVLASKGSLTFGEAAELLLPVMRGVAHAHAHGVVHRDIKPENIFIHREGDGRIVPRILDFGIAKALDLERWARITQTNQVMGTPAYMSPEQSVGDSALIGPQTDVWSMGVVWYEVLTGGAPFQGPSPVAILMAVNRRRFERLVTRLPTVPEAIASAIDKALVRDPERRYPDMGAFLDALQKAMSSAGAEDLDPSCQRDETQPPAPEVSITSEDFSVKVKLSNLPTLPDAVVADDVT